MDKIDPSAQVLKKLSHSLRTPLSTLHNEIAFLKKTEHSVDTSLLEQALQQLTTVVTQLDPSLYILDETVTLSSLLHLSHDSWLHSPSYPIVGISIWLAALERNHLAKIYPSEETDQAITLAVAPDYFHKLGITELQTTLMELSFNYSGIVFSWREDGGETFLVLYRYG